MFDMGCLVSKSPLNTAGTSIPLNATLHVFVNNDISGAAALDGRNVVTQYFFDGSTETMYMRSAYWFEAPSGDVGMVWNSWITLASRGWATNKFVDATWFDNHFKFGTRVLQVNANNGCVIFSPAELKTLFNTTDTLSNSNTVCFATNGDLAAQGHYMSACGWRNDSSGKGWMVQEVNNNNFIAGNIRINYLVIRF